MHLQAQPCGPPTAEVLAVLGLTLLDVVARLLLLLSKPARRRAAPGGGNGPRHTRQQQKHDQQVNRSRATGYGSSSTHFTCVGGRVRTVSQTRLGNGKEFRALVKRAFCGSFPASNQPVDSWTVPRRSRAARRRFRDSSARTQTNGGVQ